MDMKLTRQQYRAVRLRLNYTQEELAAKLGITRETVSKRELGKEPISCEASRALRYELVSQTGEFSLPKPDEEDEEMMHLFECVESGRQTLARFGITV